MAKAKAVKPEVTARAADPVDPKAIDTSSANVQDVRKMWQQAYTQMHTYSHRQADTHTHTHTHTHT